MQIGDLKGFIVWPNPEIDNDCTIERVA